VKTEETPLIGVPPSPATIEGLIEEAIEEVDAPETRVVRTHGRGDPRGPR
jgi:hypothetical protein